MIKMAFDNQKRSAVSGIRNSYSCQKNEGSHSDESEDDSLLGYSTMWSS
jgi:hypothetical protein